MIDGIATAALLSANSRSIIRDITITMAILSGLFLLMFFVGTAWERRRGPSATFGFERARGFGLSSAVVTAVFVVIAVVVYLA